MCLQPVQHLNPMWIYMQHHNVEVQNVLNAELGHDVKEFESPKSRSDTEEFQNPKNVDQI